MPFRFIAFKNVKKKRKEFRSPVSLSNYQSFIIFPFALTNPIVCHSLFPKAAQHLYGILQWQRELHPNENE